jgi:hypothetical protein
MVRREVATTASSIGFGLGSDNTARGKFKGVGGNVDDSCKDGEFLSIRPHQKLVLTTINLS